MRSKEDAHDYRYFPDPDLPPLVIADDWVARIQAAMPELPAHKRARFEHELGLTGYDAAQLTMNRDTSAYFEQPAAQAPQGQSKLAAHWVLGERSALLTPHDIDKRQSPVNPERMASPNTPTHH